PQDVSESHGREDSALRAHGFLMAHHLSVPLGCTQHAAGPHGLVGADENEAFHTTCLTESVEDIDGPAHIRLLSLIGVGLENRDVLQGGGVENDLWPNLEDVALEGVVVADVTEHRVHLVAPGPEAEQHLM